MSRRGSTTTKGGGEGHAPMSRFIVLTGLSGSGKTQAIRALEDLGYFCVDNLPVALIPTFAELTLRAGGEITRAAVVVDIRERSLLKSFPDTFTSLKTMPFVGKPWTFANVSSVESRSPVSRVSSQSQRRKRTAA